MQHLWRINYSYYYSKKNAEILYNLNYDAETVSSLFDNEILFGFTQLFNIIGGFIGLALINWKMMLCITLLFPIKIIIAKKFSNRNKIYTENFMKSSENKAQFEEDSLDGIKELKIYGLYNRFSQEYQKILNKSFEYEKVLHILPQQNVGIDNILAQLCIVLIYLCGAKYIIDNVMTVGSVVAFTTYSSYVLGPISTILNIQCKISGIEPAINQLNDIYNTEIEQDSIGDNIILDNYEGLELKNVCFSYNNQKSILNNFTAKIEPDSITVIVGENGVGKTTLINILLRLINNGSGIISLEGNDISDIPIKKYRENFAYVGQDAFLFCDTLRNNITLFKKIPEHIILDICKECGLKDLIDEISLDYFVGNRGTMLSGGQRQKIVLARAIASNRKYIIFDEPTSNMDDESRKMYCDLMKKYKKSRTIIIITHDSEVVKIADRVVSM